MSLKQEMLCLPCANTFWLQAAEKHNLWTTAVNCFRNCYHNHSTYSIQILRALHSMAVQINKFHFNKNNLSIIKVHYTDILLYFVLSPSSPELSLKCGLSLCGFPINTLYSLLL
jgi:hypothetical protein